MKKWLLALGAVALLAGCGSEEAEKKETETKKSEEVSVDKGLLNVGVTLPESFFADTTEEEIISSAKEEGIKEAKVNEDGSVTYVMSKSKHKEMMKEIKEEMASNVEDIVTSGDYPSIKEISYNKDFSEFDIKVDREAYENGLDGFAIFGLVLSGAYYGAFEGKAEDDLKLTFNMIDAATNEVFDSTVFPDDMEEESSETEEVSE